MFVKCADCRSLQPYTLSIYVCMSTFVLCCVTGLDCQRAVPLFEGWSPRRCLPLETRLCLAVTIALCVSGT